jgi:cobalt-zinc-cadmium efflux system protein
MHAHPHGTAAPVGRVEERAFGVSLFLAAVVLLVELAGALEGHSVALLADAGHIFADMLSLLLAYLAAHQSQRAPTPTKSYGYARATIIAAFLNALVLVLLAFGLAGAAVERLLHPVLPQPFWMGGAALVALILNLLVAARLYPHRQGLSARSVFLHYAGDAAASFGVALAAVVVLIWHVAFVDPLASLVIAFLIVRGGVPLVRQTFDILMEGTPSDVDPTEVAAVMATVPGVHGVHDLHIWNLAERQALLSCHVQVDDMRVEEASALLNRIAELLRDRFGIAHATLQVEAPGACVSGDDCSFDQASRPSRRAASGPRTGSAR